VNKLADKLRKKLMRDPFEPVMTPFFDRFPEIAEKETLSVNIIQDGTYDLPRGKYYFLESYCKRKIESCDCRRVFLNVWNGVEMLCTIGYGWEGKEYYARWFGPLGSDNELVSDAKGPILENSGYNSKYARQLLQLFSEKIMTDSDYIDRIKEHYALFKSKS